MVKRGFYRHYKGGLYLVLGPGRHTETAELGVIYVSLHYRSLHFRPLTVWNETSRTGEPRFRRVDVFHVLHGIWKKPK